MLPPDIHDSKKAFKRDLRPESTGGDATDGAMAGEEGSQHRTDQARNQNASSQYRSGVSSSDSYGQPAYSNPFRPSSAGHSQGNHTHGNHNAPAHQPHASSSQQHAVHAPVDYFQHPPQPLGWPAPITIPTASGSLNHSRFSPASYNAGVPQLDPTLSHLNNLQMPSTTSGDQQLPLNYSASTTGMTGPSYTTPSIHINSQLPNQDPHGYQLPRDIQETSRTWAQSHASSDLPSPSPVWGRDQGLGPQRFTTTYDARQHHANHPQLGQVAHRPPLGGQYTTSSGSMEEGYSVSSEWSAPGTDHTDTQSSLWKGPSNDEPQPLRRFASMSDASPSHSKRKNSIIQPSPDGDDDEVDGHVDLDSPDISRQDKRRHQNKLAQRAFRARTKVQSAEHNTQLYHLMEVNESQRRKLEEMTALVASLQKENLELRLAAVNSRLPADQQITAAGLGSTQLPKTE